VSCNALRNTDFDERVGAGVEAIMWGERLMKSTMISSGIFGMLAMTKNNKLAKPLNS
jgi:hypothetical protein